jgi:hypothetical protein
MKDHRLAVAARLDVELDAVPAGNRRDEGGAAVLDDAAPVQAAVRERHRAERAKLSLP